MFIRQLGLVLAACLLSSLPRVLAQWGLVPHGSVALRTHSLSIPFLDNDLQSRWFDYGGDTIVRTDKYVRLAGDFPSQAGYVFSRVPLTATNFEIELEFQIHGKHTLYGDGMGIFITKERAEQGTVFGLKDKFEGLAIFIDTYKNNRPGTVFPYVMAMSGDGNTEYDKHNDGKANELGGCSARGIRNTGFPAKLKATYFAEKTLTVELAYKEADKWEHCFTIDAPKVPQVSYLGLSAETGELSDNFDIFKLETRSIYDTGNHVDDGQAHQDQGKKGKAWKPKKVREPGEGGGWTWFFLKFIIFGLALTGGYVGWTIYRAQRRDRF